MHHHLLVAADLDHPVGAGPTVYRKLIEATDLLLKGEPDHPDLLARIEAMQEKGVESPRLPVNLANVIKQARCDRKALVGDKQRKPPYPKLSAFIRSIKATHGVSQGTTALIEELQEGQRDWRQRERVLRSKLAARTLELSDARRDLADAQGKLKRLSSRTAA